MMIGDSLENIHRSSKVFRLSHYRWVERMTMIINDPPLCQSGTKWNKVEELILGACRRLQWLVFHLSARRHASGGTPKERSDICLNF